MCVVAPHLVWLRQHDVHVLLACKLHGGQRLEYRAARIAVRLCGLDQRHGRCGRRFAWRRPASRTPTTNIVSHQSKSPPPPLLGGAVTVSDVDALAELPPAEAVERAFAAIVLA